MIRGSMFMTLDNNVTFLENVQGGAAVARLLEEIGEVYKTACHCGCGVDGVLTQVELIDALISRGAVPESARIVVPEREEPPIWMIRELDGPNRSRCVHAIRHEGVEYLSELRDWTFFRLRRIPTIGLISARAIELAMARRGLYLRDADRAEVDAAVAAEDAEVDMPEEEAEVDTSSPEALRRSVADELERLGQRFAKDSMSLMRKAGRLNRGERVGPALKKYVGSKLTGHRIVERLSDPLRDLEAAEHAVVRAKRLAEKTAREAPIKAQLAERVKRESMVERADNVVRPTFIGAVS